MFLNLFFFFFIINPFKICHSLFLYTLKGKTFVEEKSFNGENLSTGKTFRRRKYLSLDQMLTKCSPMKVVFLIKFSFLHFFKIFWSLLVGLVWCKRGSSIWKCFRRFFSKEYQLFYRGEFETISECFRCFKKRQCQNKRVSRIFVFLYLAFLLWYDFQQFVFRGSRVRNQLLRNRVQLNSVSAKLGQLSWAWLQSGQLVFDRTRDLKHSLHWLYHCPNVSWFT